jgi:hypothetical protein
VRTLLPVFLISILCTTTFAQEHARSAAPSNLSWMTDSMVKLNLELVAKYGDAQRDRIGRGLHQVMEHWRPEDGDAAVFEDVVRTNFAGDQATLDTMF